MIVVCGEALVDLTPTRCGSEDGFVPRAGGSPFNVAVGLARLETPVAFLGRISSDAFGRLLRGHLEDNGVDLRYVNQGPEPTALAFVHLGPGGSPDYAFHWNGTADRELSPADVPESFPPQVAAVHVGSVSLVLEPGASTLESLMRRTAGHHVVSLDPNVRPRLIPDRDAYLRRLHGWVTQVDLVKISVEDLSWLYPGTAPRAAAQALHGRGGAAVVVTDGARGAMAVTDAAHVDVAAVPVDVVDTVGAGDAFSAGLLSWLDHEGLLDPTNVRGLDEDQLRTALQFAGRVAAATCARVGADPPRRADLAGA